MYPQHVSYGGISLYVVKRNGRLQGGFDPNKSFGVKLEMDARFLGLGAKPDLH